MIRYVPTKIECLQKTERLGPQLEKTHQKKTEVSNPQVKNQVVCSFSVSTVHLSNDDTSKHKCFHHFLPRLVTMVTSRGPFISQVEKSAI